MGDSVRFCAICGRRLTKTQGSIGPVCEKKCKPKRWRRMPKDKYLKMARERDLFSEDAENGSEKNSTTSPDSEK